MHGLRAIRTGIGQALLAAGAMLGFGPVAEAQQPAPASPAATVWYVPGWRYDYDLLRRNDGGSLGFTPTANQGETYPGMRFEFLHTGSGIANIVIVPFEMALNPDRTRQDARVRALPATRLQAPEPGSRTVKDLPGLHEYVLVFSDQPGILTGWQRRGIDHQWDCKVGCEWSDMNMHIQFYMPLQPVPFHCGSLPRNQFPCSLIPRDIASGASAIRADEPAGRQPAPQPAPEYTRAPTPRPTPQQTARPFPRGTDRPR